MIRNFSKLKESKEKRDKWQFSTFEAAKDSILRDATAYDKQSKDSEDADNKEKFKAKANNLRKIVSKMKYQFNNDSKLAFGDCDKLDKPVTFLPDILQLDTQECFKHRRDS